jgi:cell division protein FtsZ
MDELEGKLKFEYAEMEADESTGIKIAVIGVGGCGCNIINDMAEFGMRDAELVAVNTDMQSLQRVSAGEKIQIGNKLTKGGGAGSNPDKGEKAAEEDRDLLESKLRGIDMLFITCGLGGGTGSGAAPVIADIARGLDILTVGVVITPTKMELDNSRKRKIVDESMGRLKDKVNSIITISNQKIFEVCDIAMTVPQAYKEANKVLINIVNGIVTMIAKPGLQNIDFEDVKATLRQKGDTFLGIGRASGTDKAKKAFERALKNPFIGEVDLNGAKEMLINFVGNITVAELKEIESIKRLTGKDASLKYGVVCDDNMGDEIEVVILISGIRSGATTASVSMPDIASEERVEVTTQMLGLGIKQIVDNNYENVEIPTYQRFPN